MTQIPLLEKLQILKEVKTQVRKISLRKVEAKEQKGVDAFIEARLKEV